MIQGLTPPSRTAAGGYQKLRTWMWLVIAATMPWTSGCVVIVTRHHSPSPAMSTAHGAPGAPVETGSAGIAHIATAPTSALPAALPANQSLPHVAAPGVLAGSPQVAPPSASLPPPADSEAMILRIQQRHGIHNISGSNATSDQLAELEDAIGRYPPGLLNKLIYDFEPADADPAAASKPNVVAYWTTADSSGQAVPRTSPRIAGGKVFFLREKTDKWTMIHETAHHVTILADPDFGRALLSGAGYGTQTPPVLGSMLGSAEDWAAVAVPPNAYPRTYSQTNYREHIADLVTTHLGGPEVLRLRRLIEGFVCPPQSKAALIQRLGTGTPST